VDLVAPVPMGAAVLELPVPSPEGHRPHRPSAAMVEATLRHLLVSATRLRRHSLADGLMLPHGSAQHLLRSLPALLSSVVPARPVPITAQPRPAIHRRRHRHRATIPQLRQRSTPPRRLAIPQPVRATARRRPTFMEERPLRHTRQSLPITHPRLLQHTRPRAHLSGLQEHSSRPRVLSTRPLLPSGLLRLLVLLVVLLLNILRRRPRTTSSLVTCHTIPTLV
jgi:hypothetical protein